MSDCNNNATLDLCDIADGTSQDNDTNGVPDECDDIDVPLDIKPGSCPNSFNRNSHGVLPVSILGTEDLDVSMIDITTLQISRSDGEGASVGPNEGPPGPHTVVEDTGTPFDGELCDCHNLTGDGVNDLSMKFNTDEVVAALMLDLLSPGDLVELEVNGTLLDGTPFHGSDCVRLVPPGTPPGLLAVQSNVVGGWLDVTPLDLQLDGGGFGAFERTYPLSTAVTLTAPAHTADDRPFVEWHIDGVAQEAGVRVIEVTMNNNVRSSGLSLGAHQEPITVEAEAVYGPPVGKDYDTGHHSLGDLQLGGGS